MKRVFVFREMRIKTTMKYFTPTEIYVVKKDGQ